MTVHVTSNAYRTEVESLRSSEAPVTLIQAYTKFVREYIWAHGYTKSTSDNYLIVIKSLERSIGEKSITKLTLEDIYMWRKDMEQQNFAPNALNKYLYTVRLFLRFCAKHYPLIIEPDEIIIPKYKQQLPKFLTVEEIDRLIAVAGTREKAIISLMYSSGMRVGEIVALRKRDIYGDSLKVRGKGNKERVSFIDERAQEYLKQYLDTRSDTCPFVFYSKKGGGLRKGQIQLNVKLLAKKAQIDKVVTPHVIRHSFATHMAQNGIGTFHLQKLLGHAHISTTQVYVHLTGSDIRQAYQKFH